MGPKKKNKRTNVRRARRILKKADVHLVGPKTHRLRYGSGLTRRDVPKYDENE